MTLSDVIDASLLVVGLAGAAGSLMGRRPFINEAQMEMLLDRFGRRAVRVVAAAGYLLLAVIGAARLLGG